MNWKVFKRKKRLVRNKISQLQAHKNQRELELLKVALEGRLPEIRQRDLPVKLDLTLSQQAVIKTARSLGALVYVKDDGTLVAFRLRN